VEPPSYAAAGFSEGVFPGEKSVFRKGRGRVPERKGPNKFPRMGQKTEKLVQSDFHASGIANENAAREGLVNVSLLRRRGFQGRRGNESGACQNEGDHGGAKVRGAQRKGGGEAGEARKGKLMVPWRKNSCMT